MNASEARQILMLYRGRASDAEDPQLAEALKLARQDPELRQWLDEHVVVQSAIRSRFAAIEVPADRKAALMSHRIVSRPAAWWRRPGQWAAAAAVIALVAASVVWFKPSPHNRFTDYQARMISTALRDYGMEVETSDKTQLRRQLAMKGGPADYKLPKGLEQLQLTGGGVLRWRNQPVSMVCFDRGDKQMLFLFVIDGAAVRDPPPASPDVKKLNRLLTASWSQDGKTYFLAGPEEADFVRKYL